MKKLTYLMIIAVMALGLYSCEKDSIEEKVTIDANFSDTISNEGGDIKLKFTASHGWTITEAADWLTIDPMLGELGDIEVTISVDENTDYDARDAKVTIALNESTIKEEVTITQEQLDAVIVEGEYPEPFEPVAGTFIIKVKHNVDFDVVITEGSDWVTRVETKGIETSKANFSYTANTTTEVRTAKIEISGEGAGEPTTYNVIQKSTKKTEQAENTFIMYLLTDMNIGNLIEKNAKEAIAAMRGNFSSKNSLVIYRDGLNKKGTADSTVLYEFRSDERGNVIKTLLKLYPEQYSTTPEVMEGVFNDIKRLAPSDNYSVVLSGHGNGWFPKSSDLGFSIGDLKSVPAQEEFDFTPMPGAEMTKAFYYDSDPDNAEGSMSTAEMVEGLSPIKFDYIIFDLCFMSSIEFLYDLRYSADYIVASPTEVMGAGFPYPEIIPLIMAQNGTPAEIAATFVESYRNQTNYRSASCAVIDCAKIDAFAQSVKEIYAGSINSDINIGQIQPLESIRGNHAFFDMSSYFKQICNTQQYDKYIAALNNMRLFDDHTAQIYSGFGGYISILGGELDLCGVNTYISRSFLPTTESHYRETAWAKFTNPPVY